MIIRYDDPRVLSAGNEAFGALVRAHGWAEANDTDEVPAAAAKMLASRRAWRALLRAELVAPSPEGYLLSSPAARADESSPRGPDDEQARRDERRLAAARRKREQRERDRARGVTVTPDVTPPACDMSRPEGVTVTPDVTLPGRDMSHPRAPLSLFSSAVSSGDPEQKEPENRERYARTSGVTSSVTERDGVTEVTPGRGSKLPAYTDPIPPFVALVLSTWAMTNGVTLDAKTEWEGFLANAHKRRDDGLRAGAGEHDFRGWVAGSVKRHQATGPRGKARGPRGIVQGGPSRGPSLSFDDTETDYGMPPLATAEGE